MICIIHSIEGDSHGTSSLYMVVSIGNYINEKHFKYLLEIEEVITDITHTTFQISNQVWW